MNGITSDGIKALAKLPKLEKLELCNVEITDEVFKYFIELKSLYLYGISTLSDAALYHIGNYTELRHLEIICNYLFNF